MIREKCSIKKNDKVKVIAGREKGKIGKVMKIDRKKGRLIVENINTIKKHLKPSAQNRQGGIIETEAPVILSNVMLMCNKCMKPVRVKHKMLDDGKKVRICGKCNEFLDA